MFTPELLSLVQDNAHIKEVWINESGVYYIHNPQKTDFIRVSREEMLSEGTEEQTKNKKKK